MKLLYLESATWEIDFICNDILSHINLEVEFFDKNNLRFLSKRQELINNNFFVVNNNCNLKNVIEVVKKIKPIIIFHLSDEYGTFSEWTILQNFCKVLFRQHHHINYNYAKNNFHLPLGYVTNYLNKQSSLNIKPREMKCREINCSFVGAFKSDRLHMSNVFQKNMVNTKIHFVENKWKIDLLAYNPEDIFNIYNNSIFVINGKGNINLDCFRIYEAIVAGAIPVIVGSKDEVNNRLNYNSIPPLICSDTWENAVIQCNDLLKDGDKLQEMQDKLLQWWKDVINNIKEKINSIL